jgi:drug/metabolite transporter (DMT)-like permease
LSGAPASTPAPTDNLRGALLLGLAALVFTAEVTLVRLVSDQTSQAQVIFFRALGQLVLSLAILQGAGWARLGTDRPGLHIARGLLSLAMWWLYYLSFRLLDMGLATTLTFTTSLFVVALAAPLLGERVGAVRWAATLAGFGGVALAAGFGQGGAGLGVVVGLLSAAGGAVIVFMNRVLSRTEPTATIMAWIGIVTCLGAAPVAALGWQPLAPWTLTVLVLTGLCGACGMWLTIEAYRVGEVSALAPVPYLRLVIAVAVGWWLFSEVPGLTVLAGSAVIILSSLAVARHEQRRGLAGQPR